MRRLLRWSANFLMVLCLLLGVACLIAWPASYWSGYFVNLTYVEYVPTSNLPEAITVGTDQVVAAHLVEVVDGWIGIDISMPIPMGRFFGAEPKIEWYLEHAEIDEAFDGSQRFMLVVYDHVLFDQTVDRAGSNYTSYFAVQMPLWLPAVVLLALGAFWVRVLFRRRRYRHRRQSGLCLHCGYNLQGVVADTCPECGHERPLVTVQDDA